MPFSETTLYLELMTVIVSPVGHWKWWSYRIKSCNNRLTIVTFLYAVFGKYELLRDLITNMTLHLYVRHRYRKPAHINCVLCFLYVYMLYVVCFSCFVFRFYCCCHGEIKYTY